MCGWRSACVSECVNEWLIRKRFQFEPYSASGCATALTQGTQGDCAALERSRKLFNSGTVHDTEALVEGFSRVPWDEQSILKTGVMWERQEEGVPGFRRPGGGRSKKTLETLSLCLCCPWSYCHPVILADPNLQPDQTSPVCLKAQDEGKQESAPSASHRHGRPSHRRSVRNSFESVHEFRGVAIIIHSFNHKTLRSAITSMWGSLILFIKKGALYSKSGTTGLHVNSSSSQIPIHESSTLSTRVCLVHFL